MTTLRHDWYETESQVTIEIFLKNQKTEDVKVEFTKDSVSVHAKLPSDVYDLELNLFQEINPERSSFKVLTTKIEIRLCKTSAGKWSVLERKPDEKPEDKTPSYPTSSLIKHDWDKLEKEIEKDTSSQDVGDLFKQIYMSGDPEVRRAMNKSFLESNGTVLSTNWDEIGKRKTEVKPPSGTEFKTFEN
ncbi:protein SGT1 homolog [Galendromus occidentalis]|uniref:Protein SGT1 homolog n=1 Tax=Galendromus occidentalis TaxID=34638 RepID=A0AAJ6QW12_9ACAR|nr:protein SGT1 homolog [Galendromus occidentalis]